MAYDTPFQLLRSEITRELALPHFAKTRRAYLDFLSILHGLLGRFSSSPNLSMFDNPDEAEELLDEQIYKIPTLLTLNEQGPDTAALRERVRTVQDYLLDIMSINKETALDLYSECVSPQKTFSYQAAHNLTDIFINVLVDQYIYLRDPARIPLTYHHAN